VCKKWGIEKDRGKKTLMFKVFCPLPSGQHDRRKTCGQIARKGDRSKKRKREVDEGKRRQKSGGVPLNRKKLLTWGVWESRD